MYSRLISSKQECLYSDKVEFLSFHPDKYLHGDWRTGQEGSWVLTDDGQVCKILKKGTFKSHSGRKASEYVRTLLGMVLLSAKSNLKGKPVRNIYSFKGDTYSDKARINRKEPTKHEIVFAKYVARGLPPEEAYLRAFPTNNVGYAKNFSSRLIKTERMLKLISEEMQEVLDEAGIKPSYLVESTKKVIDKDKARDSDKLRAIETLMKLCGMFPGEKKTESLTVFQGFSNEQLEQLRSTEVKALAHADKQIEGK